MGLFDKIKKTTKEYEAAVRCYCFLKRPEDLMQVLTCNPKFELSTKELIEAGYAGRYVYKYYSEYRSHELTLVPENKNVHDKNAVAILLNNQFFGYVNREQAPNVRKLIKKNAITGLKLRNTGGPARKIFENGQSTADCYEFEPVLTITYVI